MARPKEDTATRFWSKVDIRSDDECWEWQAFSKFGYGRFRDGRMKPAHRWVAEQIYGNISDKVVRHKCDNTLCVNPNHLELGTQADNIRDMYDRGRDNHCNGINKPNSKFTQPEVRDIFTSKLSTTELAVKYNVSAGTISQIRHGKTYKKETMDLRLNLTKQDKIRN